MKNYKNLIFALLCLSFTIIIGAGVYEHLAVFPNAFNSPPKSLSMFQGEFGLDAVSFWGNIHPITIFLFLINLIIFWKTKRKINVLISFTGYIIVIIATFIYFVPELVELTTTKFENVVDQDLVQRGSLWQSLSLIRLVFMAVLAFILYFGLTKSNDKYIKQ